MTKHNYLPWEISPKDFPSNDSAESQILFFLKFALLAPSAHNSQPWECKVEHSTITVSVNEHRNLKYGDMRSRELYLGLGCFLENLETAADYFGFSYVETPNIPSSEIQIKFEKTKNQSSDPSHLIFFISKRHSNRYPYAQRNVPSEKIQRLNNLGNDGVKLFIASEKERRDKIGQITIDSQVSAMDDTNFREELSHYLKSNFTKDKYGMPGFTVGMPAVVSMVAPKIVKKINISKLGAKKDLQMWQKHTPAIGILCVTEDEKTSWLNAGKIFERMWLTATAQSIAFSVWAAPVENETSRSKIQKILNTNLFPTVIFRLGFPIHQAKPSPRFSLEEIKIS